MKLITKKINSFSLAFITKSIRILSKISPPLAHLLISRLWFRVLKVREHINRESWLRDTQKTPMIHRKKRYTIYSKKPQNSEGQVILMHGWSGRWDQLLLIADTLYQHNLEVIVFDFPAHGENSGSSTDIFELSDFLKAVYTELNLIEPILICHSASLLTVSHASTQHHLKFAKLITINSPARTEFLIEVFKEKLKLHHIPDESFWSLVDKRTRIHEAKKQLNTKKMSIFKSSNILIIHDIDDKEVMYSESSYLKQLWPEANLISTQGNGHNRILKNPEIATKIKHFCLHKSV